MMMFSFHCPFEALRSLTSLDESSLSKPDPNRRMNIVFILRIKKIGANLILNPRKPAESRNGIVITCLLNVFQQTYYSVPGDSAFEVFRQFTPLCTLSHTQSLSYYKFHNFHRKPIGTDAPPYTMDHLLDVVLEKD